MTRPQISMSATGLYIAYLTTAELKPTTRGSGTLVNNRHTNVGSTSRSFAERRAGYESDFGTEFRFEPVLELPPHEIVAVHNAVLSAIATRFNRLDGTRNWFETDDRVAIRVIITSVVGGASQHVR